MAVTDAYILQAGVSGDATGRKKGDASHSYRVRWQAECDSQQDTAATVLEHFRRTSGLPYIGSGYAAGGDSDGSAVCTSITPTLIEKSGGIFYVDVSYEPDDGGSNQEKPSKSDPSKNTTDPREWADEIDVSSTQVSIPVEIATFRGFETADGEKVSNLYIKADGRYVPCNSAKDPYDPPLEVEVDIRVIRFIKYTDQYHAQDFDKWIGAVNSEEISITKENCNYQDQWKAYTARIKALPATSGIADGIKYWRVGLEVHVNPLGWRRQVVDRGFQVRQEAGDKRLNADGTLGDIISPSEVEPGAATFAVIKDADGYPVSTPVLLDGNGGVLGKSKPHVYGIWSTYKEISFADIQW